ncbi:MAG: cohesin domain-containing protein, partial [Candidatus Methanomethylophilaceae archaeon]|nr:cohesin domain-containing protein [Candidatus Methanomethylophilaceae archaeon]
MRHMVWSILLLTLLCGVCSAATLSVDPAESTRSYGETVDLTVRVQDVSNLGGFDIDVTWKSSVVTLDTEPGNVTIGPLFSAHVNHSAVNPQSGRIRVAGVNATLQGVSGNADLFTVRLKAVDNPGLDGASTPVSVRVNNYGFLNSTSGENITVSAVTNATITTRAPSTVDARITAASSRVFVNQSNLITASVVNRRGVDTSPLEINVSIIDDENDVVFWNTTPDVTIPKWDRFQQDIAWTPDKEGTYTAVINVTSEKPLTGTTNDSKIITAKEYTLNFTREISGPWDGRASAGSWFSMYAYVNASQSGYVWFNVTAPDHVKVYGAKNQTRYMYASDWNYVSATFWSDTPGKIAPGDIAFEVAANGMTATRGSPEVL